MIPKTTSTRTAGWSVDKKGKVKKEFMKKKTKRAPLGDITP